jgi:hypothetical protein
VFAQRRSIGGEGGRRSQEMGELTRRMSSRVSSVRASASASADVPASLTTPSFQAVRYRHRESRATTLVSVENCLRGVPKLLTPYRQIPATDLLVNPTAALASAYESEVPRSERELYPLRDFSVSDEFVPSIHRLGLTDQADILGVLIRQAVRIMSGQEARFPSMNIHPQRVGPGAGDAQMTRQDGTTAFRARITSRGAGYRLLYWKKDAAYELWEVRTESQ